MTFAPMVLLMILPVEDVTSDRVELNHFYDENGHKVFDQVIFWENGDQSPASRVVAWRMWKSPFQTPERDWLRGGYRSVWKDGDRLREVQATSIEETWTQCDPELANRSLWPPERRRLLSGEKSASRENTSAITPRGPFNPFQRPDQ